MPTLGHEEIAGLDVAVNNAFGVRGIESIGDLDGEREQKFQVEGAARDAVLQRDPVQILHRYEGPAIMPADFVDGADVGMIQRRCGPGLTPETLQRLRVLGHVGGKEFQGNEAAEFGVLGFVDHTHPTAAQFLDDAVVRDGFADHGWTNLKARS